MVLKQVLRDLRKEWAWALFYTVVAAMTAMAILYLSISFSSVRRQSSSILSFIDKNVVLFQLKSVQMEPNPEIIAAGGHPAPFDMLNYLQDSLAGNGKAGSFVFVGNDGYVDEKYEQILLLFGQYSNLAGLDYDGSMACFVPEACKEDVGRRLRVAGEEIEVVDTVGRGFELFHPLFFIEAGSSMLSNTLILCTRNFQAVNGMFPWWGLGSEVFGRMVLVDPSDAEVEELQRIFYEQYGALYTGISTEDFTRVTTIASIRTHRLYLWFYILSGVLLAFLLICNIIRMIEAHVADYTVHHLYGAPIRLIRRRVGGFALSLHVLPVIGVLFVLSVNEMALWVALPLCMALILALCAFAAGYAGKRIGTLNSLENLRRDY